MKEQDIRPHDLFERYLQLSAKDAQELLKSSDKFVDVCCFGCNSLDKKVVFKKNGFTFNKCCECNTLYCSPRPSLKQLEDFCTSSISSHFWVKEFFPVVSQVRREKLFKPKAKAIYEMFTKMKVDPQTICDIGAGCGILLEELSYYWRLAKLRAIEPGKEFAVVCRKKGFEVLQETAENSNSWAETIDLILSFEVIEHVHDVNSFIRSLFELIKPGGHCLISGLCSEGFDIGVLKGESNSVFPPHHINFLSIDGAKALFKRVGFENISITTPGKLDVDIVRNKLRQRKDLVIPDWIRTLLERGDAAYSDFQSFLVRHRLSSHMWIVARKPQSNRVKREEIL